MLSRPFFLILGLVLLCLASLTSASADEITVRVGDRRFRIKHWTAEDGLPQNEINALEQTPDGYLWIATWTGLVRFDGDQFTTYKEEGILRNATINDLLLDSQGVLWIASHQGLFA